MNLEKPNLEICKTYCNESQIFPAMRYFIEELQMSVNGAAKEVSKITHGLVTQDRAREVWRNRMTDKSWSNDQPKSQTTEETEEIQKVATECYLVENPQESIIESYKEELKGQNDQIKECPNCSQLYDSTRWDFSLSGKCPYCLNIDKQRDTIATKWTGDQEGYTPRKYIESSRLVMGSIDIDPASNEYANQIVKAKCFFTKDDSGLKESWYGNVFLNPPYSQPEINHFVEKLIDEYLFGNTKQAILLTNNNTDTRWFHNASEKSRAICFTKGRINFYKPDGSITHPTNGQAFFYFGNNVNGFAKEFQNHGIVLTKYE